MLIKQAELSVQQAEVLVQQAEVLVKQAKVLINTCAQPGSRAHRSAAGFLGSSRDYHPCGPQKSWRTTAVHHNPATCLVASRLQLCLLLRQLLRDGSQLAVVTRRLTDRGLRLSRWAAKHGHKMGVHGTPGAASPPYHPCKTASGLCPSLTKANLGKRTRAPPLSPRPHPLILVEALGFQVGRLQALQQLPNLGLRLLLVQHAWKAYNEVVCVEERAAGQAMGVPEEASLRL